MGVILTSHLQSWEVPTVELPTIGDRCTSDVQCTESNISNHLNVSASGKGESLLKKRFDLYTKPKRHCHSKTAIVFLLKTNSNFFPPLKDGVAKK